MLKTLYFRRLKFLKGAVGSEPQVAYQTSFGVLPKDYDFASMKKRVSLKNDLRWRELKHLRVVMESANFWDGFPMSDLRLVTAEIKAGREPQRIDLLYVGKDGGVFPCELKVGGFGKDTHGQVIRYLADLRHQPVTREWLVKSHERYLKRIQESNAEDENVKFELQKFREWIADVEDEKFHHVKGKAFIIDEGFPSALVGAVNYLNSEHGFELRLFMAEAYVEESWTPDTLAYGMRLDFVEDSSFSNLQV